MWQKKQTKLLKEELESLLVPLSDVVSLHNLVKEPLLQSKRVLAAENGANRPWPLLPLITCEAISGDFERALPAAISLQLLQSAAEVFDDIEDADSAQSLAARYNSALATNAGTTLLILAEKAITRLKRRGVEDQVIVRVMDVINSYYITACTGQHLDLSLRSEQVPSEEIYLRIIDT